MMVVLRKMLRFFALLVLGVFIVGNLFIILSGRFYLYNGIYNTYLSGHSSPTIYDLDVFHNSKLDKSEHPIDYVISKYYNKQVVADTDKVFLKEMDTKAFLVFKGDTLLFEEYYDEHDKDELSNSFSMAKSVVAMLIGIAIEEGYIESLDTKIGKYLPEFSSGEKSHITIRHLLIMASGLDWTESGNNPLSDNAESYYGWDLRNLVLNQKAIEEPGQMFNYQSGNTQLLAFILEAATKMDLTYYADEKIWKPLGCSDDAYWSLDRKGGDEKAFCCLYATARDFGKLGQLLINKGRYNNKQIIPKWYYYEMISPNPVETKEGIANQRYGLHLWTYFGDSNPVYYLRGIKGQYVITVPNEQLVIVRVGTGRLPVYQIPEEQKSNPEYVAKNYHQVGHSLGLFRYLSLGKNVVTQSQLQ